MVAALGDEGEGEGDEGDDDGEREVMAQDTCRG